MSLSLSCFHSKFLTLFLVQTILVSFSFWKASCSPSPEVFASTAHPYPRYGTILILGNSSSSYRPQMKSHFPEGGPAWSPRPGGISLYMLCFAFFPLLPELLSHLSGYRSNRCLFYTQVWGCLYSHGPERGPCKGQGKEKIAEKLYIFHY